MAVPTSAADAVSTPPKTQAALLEAMQERQVTVSGTTYSLDEPFLVLATQNPIEQEGTYPLPEAQLDRFLFKIDVGYPTRDQERQVVALHGHGSATPDIASFQITPVVGLDALDGIRAAVGEIRLSDENVDYVVDLVRSTRDQPSLLCGASPRAANMLSAAARALAAVRGRDFVIPDDVKDLAVPALAHRVLLAPGAEIEGLTSAAVIRQVLEQVAAPR